MSIPIVVLEPHPDFIQPCSASDIETTLVQIPPRFLDGLERIVILAGTKKQVRAMRLFRYGCYASGMVFLHAYPRHLMTAAYGSEFKPSTAREYERAGAIVEYKGGETIVSFDHASLRRFYLYDVLLHEIGHHVDSRRLSRPSADAEHYAEWFAEAQSRLIDASR